MQDTMTNAQAVMTTDHAYIHDNKGFSVVFNTGELAHTSGTYSVSLTTPAKSTRKAIHLRPTSLASTASLMKFELLEDSVFTGGTTMCMFNNFRKENSVPSLSTFKAGVTAAAAGKNLMASTAGGGFLNQPAGDAIEVVSDSEADVGQKVTVYGTITGATTTVTTEIIELNGTTAVESVIQTWQNILGVELDGECAGTVTVQEASGGADIITLATTVLSAGVATITEPRARDQILRRDANGSSAKLVGVIGLDPKGNSVSVVAALNNTTEADLGTAIFRTVSKILIGDVAAETECWILRPEIRLIQALAGAAGSTSARAGGTTAGQDDEFVLETGTDYVLKISNIGTSSASTGYVSLFFYEEDIIGIP